MTSGSHSLCQHQTRNDSQEVPVCPRIQVPSEPSASACRGTRTSYCVNTVPTFSSTDVFSVTLTFNMESIKSIVKEKKV